MLLLFIGSGAAALIYEVVWFQLLQLVIGSSAISMGVLLGTFMGGMCLGSFLLPRYLDARQHPLRVYAFLELGIGAVGLLLLFGMPLVSVLYTSIGGPVFFRVIIAIICLLPPTLMMGATLPAVARFVETSPQGVSWMGFFYGGNIAGAVFGSLLAGFYLLRVHDMAFATYVAVAIDIVVVLASLALARATTYDAPEADPAAEARKWWSIPHGTWPIYLTLGISGATALASEAVWTRMLSLLLGATTYTFSLILASFLTGLGRVREHFTARFLNPAEPRDRDGNIVLDMVPKQTLPTMARLVLSFDPRSWEVRRAVVYDQFENTVTMQFRKPTINGGLADSLFTFVAPKGVATVPLR